MTNERLFAAGLEQLSGLVNKFQADMNKTLGKFESDLAGLQGHVRRNADVLDKALRSLEAYANHRAADQTQYRAFVAEMKEKTGKLEEAIEKVSSGLHAEKLGRELNAAGQAAAPSKKSKSGAQFEPLPRQDSEIPDLSEQPDQGWTSAFGDWPQTSPEPGNRPDGLQRDGTDVMGDAAFGEAALPADGYAELYAPENSRMLWIEPRKSKGGYFMAILAILLLVSTLAAALALNVDIKEQRPAGPAVSIPMRTLSSLDPPSTGFSDTVFGVEVPSAAQTIEQSSPTISPEDWQNRRSYNSIVQMANFGNPAAQTVLGLWAIDDLGAAPVDLKAAVRYLTLAAKQGQAVAQYRLGSLYEHADGVPPDLAQAAHWYEMAARQGNRRAMHNLAVFHVAGALGKKNMQEAAHWLENAAALGLPDSQSMLAMLYERGDGVPPSLLQAYKWDLIAAQSGFQQARKHLDRLKRQMNKVDVEAAASLAAAFRPQPLNEAANNPPQPDDL